MTLIMALLPLFLSLLPLAVDSLTDASVPDMFFPYGPDVGDSVVPVGDDASSPGVVILSGFPYLHGNFTTAFVSSFGVFIYVYVY